MCCMRAYYSASARASASGKAQVQQQKGGQCVNGRAISGQQTNEEGMRDMEGAVGTPAVLHARRVHTRPASVSALQVLQQPT